MTHLFMTFSNIFCCALSAESATWQCGPSVSSPRNLSQLHAVVLLLLPQHTAEHHACIMHNIVCMMWNMAACLSAGHDRTGTTVWLALTLWTTMALGEAALLSQSSMSLAVWCAIFGLPSLYLQCRHILDVLVEEALQLVAAFLRAGGLLHFSCIICLKFS